VQEAAEALQGAGCLVRPVGIPGLEQNNSLDVCYCLHVMERKHAFVEATTGHENEIFKIANAMLTTPDTAPGDYVLSEQAVERLKDGFAEYFQHYDALLCPVLPIPAHHMGSRNLSSTASLCPPSTFKALPWRST
jgi:aspartyl-tRNA(Asn)/glutamyl-tRNA(Gln) amidotransferase subunit A